MGRVAAGTASAMALDQLLAPVPEDDQIRVELVDVSTTGVKEALMKVSVTAKPGEVTLVLSPQQNGQGCSSTLLNLIAVADSNLRWTGSVLYNGRTSAPEAVGMALGDEELDAGQCVGEALQARAAAAVGRGCGEVVDVLLRALGLLDHAYSHIGHVGDESGVPQHVRRRLQLALALVDAPRLVVVQEPFAGAEAEDAGATMALLRRLADSGRTVVVGTDEGLAQELYEQVDTVLLLSKGKVMYYGTAAAAESWFESQGHTRVEGQSMADFMVDLSDGALGADPEAGEFARAESVEVAAAYLKEFPAGYHGGKVPEMVDDV